MFVVGEVRSLGGVPPGLGLQVFNEGTGFLPAVIWGVIGGIGIAVGSDEGLLGVEGAPGICNERSE